MRPLVPIRHSLVLLLNVTVFSGSLIAQRCTQEQDIFAQIATQSSGGNMTITQPNWLRDLVDKTTFHIARSSVQTGCHIQVYTSNMRDAEQEAYRLASQVRGAVPELSAYVTHSTPFWRLLVGDYGSRQEAQQQLSALHASHPRLVRETYIVREELRLHQDLLTPVLSADLPLELFFLKTIFTYMEESQKMLHTSQNCVVNDFLPES